VASKSKAARRQRWAHGSQRVAAKAEKGRSLQGAEKAAVLQRLANSKREKAEVARKVAVAAVKVERRIAQRLAGLDGSATFSSRGLGNTLTESDQRNQLAAQIAERRQENSERKLRQQEDRAAHMDTACKRAWDNRLDVRPIIERELYGRRRAKAIDRKPEFEEWEAELDRVKALIGP
jgi:hypothetical protein